MKLKQHIGFYSVVMDALKTILYNKNPLNKINALFFVTNKIVNDSSFRWNSKRLVGLRYLK